MPSAARVKAVPESEAKLPRRVLAAYAVPAFSQSLIHGPAIGVIVQGIYVKQFGVALRSMALILLLSGILDAVLNPAVGVASDRYRERYRSRKPWLVFGSIVAALACWYLYAPTPPVTTGYFVGWLLLSYVGWTATEVPYSAWMAEISSDYGERTRLATWRASCMYLGSLSFFCIPYLPLLQTTEFTAQSLRWTALLAVLTLPTFALIAVSLVPTGDASPPPARLQSQNAWRGVLMNRPLRIFALMFFLYNFGSALSVGATFFFFEAYLHQGKALASLFLLGFPAGLLGVPMWGYLCLRFNKQRAWALSAAAGSLLLLAWCLVPQGSQSVPWSAALIVLTIATWSVFPVAAPSMLTDIVDYGRLRFGRDYAGVYFAIYNLMYKAIPGIGGAAALALLDTFGFDPHQAAQSASGRTGLLLTYSVLPALVVALSVPLLWRFPINPRRQRVIARRLRQRDGRRLCRDGISH